MGRALPTWMRQRIVEEHLAGKSLTEIAREHALSYSTVCRCWHRYQERGCDGLAPDYPNCGKQGPSQQDLVYRAARWLKFLHRAWGAPLIRLKLEARYRDRTLPSVRTFQRWFKKAGLTPLRKRLPDQKRCWAKTPHQIWQIDAKERLRLPSGQRACYLTIVDECSGALLEALVFPPQPHLPSRSRATPGSVDWGLPALGHAGLDQGR